MRNYLKIINTMLGIILILNVLAAQDYKHPHGLVDNNGKVSDADGNHIGWVSRKGMVTDMKGRKIVHINSNGNVIDMKSGKMLGHAPKSGNFVYHFDDLKKDSLTTSHPMNGTCEVKNGKGEVVALVHENYKHYGACAYHCLAMQKDKKKHMKMVH
jgi:hypothetical protein